MGNYLIITTSSFIKDVHTLLQVTWFIFTFSFLHANSTQVMHPKKSQHIFIFDIKLFHGSFWWNTQLFNLIIYFDLENHLHWAYSNFYIVFQYILSYFLYFQFSDKTKCLIVNKISKIKICRLYLHELPFAWCLLGAQACPFI